MASTKINGHSSNGVHARKSLNGVHSTNGTTISGANGFKESDGNHDSLDEHQSRFKWFFSFMTLDSRIALKEGESEYPEEPHTGRRKEILTKHPEIKSLMGYDPWIVAPVSASVLSQFVLFWLIRDASWPTLFCMAYCIGGVFNHSLGSAIHEIGHNLAFGHGKRAWMNRWLSIWCNLPLGVPMAITYKKYHADHHRYMGEEMNDVDIPTRLESFLFQHPITKIIWLIFHPLLHALRPFYKSPKALTKWEMINSVVQFSFDFLVFYFLGIKSTVYMVVGTLMAMGFHPLAGHFISEHYMFTKGQATHSYYGPLNFILYNVGYHNEHHDFPYIPYTRLPALKRMAPEYYDNLPYHTSWIKVIWDFIFDRNMGPHAHGVAYMTDEAKKQM